MINHHRTLLLNVDGTNNPGSEFPGEEYVDPAFRARRLPTFLQNLRQEFFGSDPDRLMLNYRLRQIMGAIHATDLDEYTRVQDSRITYLPFRPRKLFAEETFTPQVTVLSGTDLEVVGDPTPIDALGKARQSWAITVISITNVRVVRQVTVQSSLLQEYTVTSGLTDLLDLTGSGYSFRVRDPSPGEEFRVEVNVRPQKDLGEIVANVDAMSEVIKLQLFGLTRDEPWETLRNIWQDRKEVPWRVAALTVAMALRTDEQITDGS